MSRFTEQELEWCRISAQLDQIETTAAIASGTQARPAHDVPACIAKEVDRLLRGIGESVK